MTIGECVLFCVALLLAQPDQSNQYGHGSGSISGSNAQSYSSASASSFSSAFSSSGSFSGTGSNDIATPAFGLANGLANGLASIGSAGTGAHAGAHAGAVSFANAGAHAAGSTPALGGSYSTTKGGSSMKGQAILKKNGLGVGGGIGLGHADTLLGTSDFGSAAIKSNCGGKPCNQLGPDVGTGHLPLASGPDALESGGLSDYATNNKNGIGPFKPSGYSVNTNNGAGVGGGIGIGAADTFLGGGVKVNGGCGSSGCGSDIKPVVEDTPEQGGGVSCVGTACLQNIPQKHQSKPTCKYGGCSPDSLHFPGEIDGFGPSSAYDGQTKPESSGFATGNVVITKPGQPDTSLYFQTAPGNVHGISSSASGGISSDGPGFATGSVHITKPGGSTHHNIPSVSHGSGNLYASNPIGCGQNSDCSGNVPSSYPTLPQVNELTGSHGPSYTTGPSCGPNGVGCNSPSGSQGTQPCGGSYGGSCANQGTPSTDLEVPFDKPSPNIQPAVHHGSKPITPSHQPTPYTPGSHSVLPHSLPNKGIHYAGPFPGPSGSIHESKPATSPGASHHPNVQHIPDVQQPHQPVIPIVPHSGVIVPTAYKPGGSPNQGGSHYTGSFPGPTGSIHESKPAGVKPVHKPSPGQAPQHHPVPTVPAYNPSTTATATSSTGANAGLHYTGPFPGPSGSIHASKPSIGTHGHPVPAGTQFPVSTSSKPMEATYTSPSYPTSSTNYGGTTAGATASSTANADAGVHYTGPFPGPSGSVHDSKPAKGGYNQQNQPIPTTPTQYPGSTPNAGSNNVPYPGAYTKASSSGGYTPQSQPSSSTQYSASTANANAGATSGSYTGSFPGSTESIHDSKPSNNQPGSTTPTQYSSGSSQPSTGSSGPKTHGNGYGETDKPIVHIIPTSASHETPKIDSNLVPGVTPEVSFGLSGDNVGAGPTASTGCSNKNCGGPASVGCSGPNCGGTYSGGTVADITPGIGDRGANAGVSTTASTGCSSGNCGQIPSGSGCIGGHCGGSHSGSTPAGGTPGIGFSVGGANAGADSTAGTGCSSGNCGQGPSGLGCIGGNCGGSHSGSIPAGGVPGIGFGVSGGYAGAGSTAGTACLSGNCQQGPSGSGCIDGNCSGSYSGGIQAGGTPGIAFGVSGGHAGAGSYSGSKHTQGTGIQPNGIQIPGVGIAGSYSSSGASSDAIAGSHGCGPACAGLQGLGGLANAFSGAFAGSGSYSGSKGGSKSGAYASSGASSGSVGVGHAGGSFASSFASAGSSAHAGDYGFSS